MKTLRKYWYFIPVIIGILAAVYGWGQDNAKRDAKIDTNTTGIGEMKLNNEEIKDDVDEIKVGQAIQTEFYRLLKPDLWARAEEIVNNMDSISQPQDSIPSDSIPPDSP